MTKKELDEKILSSYAAFSDMQVATVIQQCTEALEQCTKYNYHDGIGGCYTLLSKINSRKKEWEKAIAAMELAYGSYLLTDDSLAVAFKLYDLAYLHSQAEHHTIAIDYCTKALEAFQEIDDKYGEAESTSLLGSILGDISEFEAAVENLKKAFDLKIHLNDLDGAGSDCINIAAIYLYLNENERAIGYLQQAITLKEQYKAELESGVEGVGVLIYNYTGYTLLRKPNDSTLADAYLNLGPALSAIGKHTEAVEALDKALNIKQSIGDRYGEAVAYNQLGSMLIDRNETSKAEWYLQQAHPLFKTLGHKHSEGMVWYNLGRIYRTAGRSADARLALEKAEELFQGLDIPYDSLFVLQQKAVLAIQDKSFDAAEHLINHGLTVSKNISAKEFEIEFLKHYSELYSGKGSLEAAIESCEMAIGIAREQKLLSQEASILHMLAGLHKKKGDYRISLELFEQFHGIQEQIINTQSARHVASMQVLHETEIHRKNEELARAQIIHLETLLAANNQSILIQMNELNTFRKEVLSITKQLDRAENIVRKVKTKLRESPVMQDTWGSYLETFTKVHPDFQATLLAAYPDLTAMEMKVCILIRAGLQTEEISQILSLSARTIENHRFNLRKKLRVGERENLAKFLMNI